jgi:LmbE family N-acetylglucosaminyl deacetylase
LTSDRVLVVAAHPDDEVIGCGGTMARLTAGGAFVHVAFLADGVTSRRAEDQLRHEDLETRRAASRAALEVLGVTSVSFGDYPDNRMDDVLRLDVARVVETLVDEHRPGLVLTHHAGDLNVDHRRVHEAVATACRPQPGHPVHTILCFEVASSTGWGLAGSQPFEPTWFIDITRYTEAKARALRVYEREMRPWPHARSHEAIDHLQRWRGAAVGVAAAEAFILGRRVEGI